MKEITLLTTAEIVDCYNQIAKTPVKKFSERKVAESRLAGVLGISYEKFLEVLVATDANPEVIEAVKKVLKSQKAPGPVQPSVAPQASSASETPAQASAEASEEPRKPRVLVKADDLIIYNAIKELSNPEVEDGYVTNNQIIKAHGSLGDQFINNALCRLYSSKVILLDDQSTKQERLYFCKIDDSRIPVSKKRELDGPVKAKKEPRAPREGAILKTQVITVLSAENPRREGTWGWKSFGLYRTGMTVSDYYEAGGRSNDLRWDLAHKYISIA